MGYRSGPIPILNLEYIAYQPAGATYLSTTVQGMKIRQRKNQIYKIFLHARQNKRTRHRYKLIDLLAQMPHGLEVSEEDHAWLNIAPVGYEFGSPDFERMNSEHFLKGEGIFNKVTVKALKGLLHRPAKKVSIDDMNRAIAEQAKAEKVEKPPGRKS